MKNFEVYQKTLHLHTQVYRLYLFDEGLSVAPESLSLGKGVRKRRGIKMEARSKVIEQKGDISPAQALRKRVASFSNGVAIGGERFVKMVAARYRKEMGRKKEQSPEVISSGGGGFYVMRE